MVRIKEKAALPSELPPAKLYLDDAAEIADWFREAARTPVFEASKNAEVETIFGLNGKKYDDVNDLRGLRPTTDFFINVKKGNVATIELKSRESYHYFRAFGLSEDSEWAIYGRLKLLFEKRAYGRLDELYFFARRLGPFGLVLLVLLLAGGLFAFTLDSAQARSLALSGLPLLGAFGGIFWFALHTPTDVWTLTPRSSEERPRLLKEFLDSKTVAPALWVLLGMLVMWLIERVTGGSR